MERTKKARRILLAQPGSRGSDRMPATEVYPPSLRSVSFGNGTVRMRSGSGRSRTTTTSDSGDWDDTEMPGLSRTLGSSFLHRDDQHHYPQALASTLPLNRPWALSGAVGSSNSPISQPNTASLHPPGANPPAVLSPIAMRTRERDADAMEKYKLRQRSGSATTASTDSPWQNDSVAGGTGSQEDDISKLVSVVGSVAPDGDYGRPSRHLNCALRRNLSIAHRRTCAFGRGRALRR